VRHTVGTYSAGVTVPGEYTRGYSVPASGVARAVGWDNSAETCGGGVPGVPKTAGPRSAAFWLQRLSLLRWVNLTPVAVPSCASPYPSVLAVSPGEAPSCQFLAQGSGAFRNDLKGG